MIINNRQFNESNNPDFFIFDRKCDPNVSDISVCAALSMHKAIIGICGLDTLEMAETKIGIDIRQAKAIQVYYIIYHIFTCCMLLDSDYQIRFKKDKNGNVSYGVPLETMRKIPQYCEDWNNRKFLEEDLATKLSHGDIKYYCRELRKKVQNNGLCPSLQTLYDTFINERTAVILYEKAAYIRDRTIYRPSNVASFTNDPIQTSLNFREQIDSLPNAKQLYEISQHIHLDICSSYKDGEQLFYSYMHLFQFVAVNCEPDYAAKLGYSLQELREIGVSIDNESVPSYFAQLMELYSRTDSIRFYNKYWKDLINETFLIEFG